MTERWRQQDVDKAIRGLHATDPILRPHCTVTATVRVGPVALCSSCYRRRSSVGKGQPSVPLDAGPALDLLAWIGTAHQVLEEAEQTLLEAITRARQKGTTWPRSAPSSGSQDTPPSNASRAHPFMSQRTELRAHLDVSHRVVESVVYVARAAWSRWCCGPGTS
jgi:hypothetical protein